MFLIDFEKEEPLYNVALYLTVEEAAEMIEKLQKLLKNPEAYEHFHIIDQKTGKKEISCSLITEKKLMSPKNKYTALEKRVFLENK